MTKQPDPGALAIPYFLPIEALAFLQKKFGMTRHLKETIVEDQLSFALQMEQWWVNRAINQENTMCYQIYNHKMKAKNTGKTFQQTILL